MLVCPGARALFQAPTSTPAARPEQVPGPFAFLGKDGGAVAGRGWNFTLGAQLRAGPRAHPQQEQSGTFPWMKHQFPTAHGEATQVTLGCGIRWLLHKRNRSKERFTSHSDDPSTLQLTSTSLRNVPCHPCTGHIPGLPAGAVPRSAPSTAELGLQQAPDPQPSAPCSGGGTGGGMSRSRPLAKEHVVPHRSQRSFVSGDT